MVPDRTGIGRVVNARVSWKFIHLYLLLSQLFRIWPVKFKNCLIPRKLILQVDHGRTLIQRITFTR
jgi:hypothetical protein